MDAIYVSSSQSTSNGISLKYINFITDNTYAKEGEIVMQMSTLALGGHLSHYLSLS